MPNEKELALIAAIGLTAEDGLKEIKIIVAQKIEQRQAFGKFILIPSSKFTEGIINIPAKDKDGKPTTEDLNIEDLVNDVLTAVSGCPDEAKLKKLEDGINELTDACVLGFEPRDIRNVRLRVRKAWRACLVDDSNADQVVMRKLESDIADIAAMTGVQANVDISQKIEESTERFKEHMTKEQDRFKERQQKGGKTK
jgi:hypothetical protein